MKSIDQLRDLGNAGFIVGPNESEIDFVKRVDTLKNLAQNPHSFLKEGEYQPLICDFQELGANPEWIPQTYSNRRLLPWQGAASWIFTTKQGIHYPMVQLRTGFKKGRFLFYDRDEVLRHEALHAIRLTFNEPRYEEILAYFHSKKRWRRWLGPIFRKPWDALFFTALIFLSLSLQITSLFFSKLSPPSLYKKCNALTFC